MESVVSSHFRFPPFLVVFLDKQQIRLFAETTSYALIGSRPVLKLEIDAQQKVGHPEVCCYFAGSHCAFPDVLSDYESRVGWRRPLLRVERLPYFRTSLLGIQKETGHQFPTFLPAARIEDLSRVLCIDPGDLCGATPLMARRSVATEQFP